MLLTSSCLLQERQVFWNREELLRKGGKGQKKRGKQEKSEKSSFVAARQEQADSVSLIKINNVIYTTFVKQSYLCCKSLN